MRTRFAQSTLRKCLCWLLHARLSGLYRVYCRDRLRVREFSRRHRDSVTGYLGGKLTVIGNPVGSVSLYPGYRVPVGIVLGPRTIRRNGTGTVFPNARPATVAVDMIPRARGINVVPGSFAVDYVFARGQCVGVFRDIMFIIRSIRPSRISLLLLGTALGFSALVPPLVSAPVTLPLCAPVPEF